MSRLDLEAQPSLTAALEQIFHYQAAQHTHITCPILQSFDLLKQLSSIRKQSLVYWSSRDGKDEIAAWGLAEVIQGSFVLSRAQGFAAEKKVRLFGCLSFDKSQTEDHLFWLPEWSLIQKNQYSVLHWHRPNPDIASFHPQWHSAQLHPRPSKQHWISRISALKEAFSSGMLSKVVFAQQNIVQRPSTLGPIQSLEKLTQTEDKTFDFCFAPHPDYAFIGRSPERLIELKSDQIRTEALAGTRPRGRSIEEDQQLENDLFQSTKERMEHQIVVEAICQSLLPYVSSIDKRSEPTILKLSQVQHLHTPIQAKLKPNIPLSEVIDALHPTPAVCGTPRAKAMDIIRQTEDFKRGWYAGLVGWVEGEAAEFAVGIRSALYTKNQIYFWAGAGIVAQSDPIAEWDEIEAKGKQFLDLVSQ